MGARLRMDSVTDSGGRISEAVARGKIADQLRFIVRRDLFVVLSIVVLLPVAWIVPESRWGGLTLQLAGLLHRIGLASTVIPAQLADPSRAAELRQFQLEYTARLLEFYASVLKHYRPGSWKPAVALEGESHLAEAAGRGRGVILWVPICHASSVLTKAALCEAGYRVTHLSHVRHGASTGSWVGRTFLNPVWTAVEKRYLRDRVVIVNLGERAPLKHLRRRLREGGVVSITVTRWGLSTCSTPMSGGRRLVVANGAPKLALLSGAALLPVTTRRDSDGFTVEIHPALEPDGANQEQRLQSMVTGLARVVEDFLERDPDQWKAWDLIELEESGRNE